MNARKLFRDNQWFSTQRVVLWSLLAVLAMALVIAAPAAHSPAAEAAAGEVLIYDNSASDGGNGVTQLSGWFSAAGKTPVVVSPAAWAAMTTADFAAYDAIALADPTCRVGTSAISEAVLNAATWGAAVDGNVIVIGTDEVFHSGQGGSSLMDSATDFVVAQAGKTGAYISLSCYYHNVVPSPLTWLDDAFGGTWGVTGVGCFNDSHLVATHPALAGLTDAILSNWSCSVHEAITSWPINFEVLAIAEGIGAVFTAPDGTVGTPYILARGVEVISDIDLCNAGCPTPAEATNVVGTSHTVTAVVSDSVSGPLSGVTVTFTVVAGPHTGATGTDVTDATGTATFSYTGTTVGDDVIEATFVDGAGRTQRSNRVIKHWIEDSGAPKAVVTTEIHFTDHTPLPCYAPDCGGQLAPANSIVHDEVTVTNNSASKTPTGRVSIAFWLGTRHCTGKPPASVENVVLAGSAGVTTAESSNSVALAPGDYSYRAIYFPDAAAKTAGFITTPSACEQLQVLKPVPAPVGPDSPQP